MFHWDFCCCHCLFCSCIVALGFLPWEYRVAFPGESQVRQSSATQTTVHAGCVSVSIIHRTLTWTTGSLTCAQMLVHAIAHGGVRTHVRESAQKVEFGRKILCRTGESNLRQRCAGPALYHLSYSLDLLGRMGIKNQLWISQYLSTLPPPHRRERSSYCPKHLWLPFWSPSFL